MLAVFGFRLLSTARQKSPTYDEAFYITYGFSVLKTGDYRMSMDKPPLVPLVSAIPLRWLHLSFDTQDEDWKKADEWLHANKPWFSRDLLDPRWDFSQKFLYGNTSPPETIVFRARASVIVFVVLLLACCFLLTRRLFGPLPAFIFLFLYSFCPNILAYSSLVSEDAVIAALFYASVLSFICLLSEQTRRSATIAGVFLGLALISKFTAVLILPVLAIVLALAMYRKDPGIASPRKLLIDLLVFAATSALVVAAAYLAVHLPLYASALRNTALYQARGHMTYCLGKFSGDGFWYYYLVCILLKTPLALFGLLAMSASILISRAGWRDLKPLLLAIPVILLVLVASANRIQVGVRYILPIYPFLFCIAAFAAARYWKAGALLCLLFAVSSVAAHPDYLSYFNGLAGGSARGIRYLSDANVDWGQDLWALREYVRENGVSDVILSYYGATVPESMGFPFQNLYSFGLYGKSDHLNSLKPAREILAVSATNLNGLYLREKLGPDPFAWLRPRKPMGRVGGSIFLYDITHDAGAHEHLANMYFIAWMEYVRHETMRALSINPKSPWALVLSSCFAVHDGNLDAAIREAETAVSIEPNLSSIPVDSARKASSGQFYCGAFSDVGELLMRRRRFNTALAIAQKAIDIDPACLPGAEVLAASLYSQGRKDEAKSISQEIVRSHPESKIAQQILSRN
ncbi:MAG TPA: hypothetical protein DCP85_09075 [Elusimicrobia bacterium]|nr:hypothetical protein [Elusimicrobiota bacterium]